MKTTNETLQEIIADVNHAEELSEVLKEALPLETLLENKRSVAELLACLGRIKQGLGDLQHSFAQDENRGSLNIPPAGFVAQS
jgi:hypothetical protein